MSTVGGYGAAVSFSNAGYPSGTSRELGPLGENHELSAQTEFSGRDDHGSHPGLAVGSAVAAAAATNKAQKNSDPFADKAKDDESNLGVLAGQTTAEELETAFLSKNEILGGDSLLRRPQKYDPVEAQKTLNERISTLVDQFEQVLDRIDEYVDSQTPNDPTELAQIASDGRVLGGLVNNADTILEGLLASASTLIEHRQSHPTHFKPAKPTKSDTKSPSRLNIVL